MNPRLAFALETVFQAGKLTLGYFQTGLEVIVKEDDTPVTIADRNAERLIREAIAKKFPGETILGEEEGATGSGTTRWVIDPIDGTKSFIAGVPLYANLLSYEVEGEPTIGICYLPALDQMVYATKSEGAFCNGRPISVSKNATLEGAKLSCGGHATMVSKGRMPAFLKLAEKALATRTWCDAYGHALVAMGRIDAMVDPSLHRWDISPMALIVKEAGGKSTDFAGTDQISDEAISSNGLLHAQLIHAFQSNT